MDINLENYYVNKEIEELAKEVGVDPYTICDFLDEMVEDEIEELFKHIKNKKQALNYIKSEEDNIFNAYVKAWKIVENRLKTYSDNPMSELFESDKILDEESKKKRYQDLINKRKQYQE